MVETRGIGTTVDTTCPADPACRNRRHHPAPGPGTAPCPVSFGVSRLGTVDGPPIEVNFDHFVASAGGITPPGDCDYDGAVGMNDVSQFTECMAGPDADSCVCSDMDCDGDIDFDDINPFVLALTGQEAYEAAFPDCEWEAADIDGNGMVDFDDINPFVALLSGA